MFQPPALILLTSQPLPSHEHARGVIHVTSGVTLSPAPLAHTEGEEAPLTLPPSEGCNNAEQHFSRRSWHVGLDRFSSGVEVVQ